MSVWPTMASCRISVLLFAAVCLAPVCAIYEHQAGERDWHRSHIGEVFTAKSSRSHPQHAVVASKSGVVASLTTKSGNIRWRHVLADGEDINQLQVHDNDVICISNDSTGQSIVRVWSFDSGAFQWESRTSTLHREYAELAGHLRDQALARRAQAQSTRLQARVWDMGGSSGNAVLSVEPDLATLLSLKTGEEIWTWAAPSSHTLVDVGTQKNLVFIVCINDANDELVFVTLDSSGNPAAKERKYATGPSTSIQDIVVLSNGVTAVVDRTKKTVRMFDPERERQTIDPKAFLEEDDNVENLSIDAIPMDVDTMTDVDPHFSVNVGQKAVVFRVSFDFSADPGNAVSKMIRVVVGAEGRLPILSAYTTSKGSVVLASVDSDLGQVYTSLWKDEAPFTSVVSSLVAAVATSAFVIASSDAESASVSFLVVAADHSLFLTSGRNVRWTRHEALASISHTEVIDTPQSSLLVSNSSSADEFPSFVPRLFSQVDLACRKLIDMFMIATASSSGASSFSEMIEMLTAHKPPAFNSHRFGLHKILLAMTRVGVLYALDSTNGEVIWSLPIADDSYEFHLFQTRRATTSVTEPPECVLFAQHKQKKPIVVRFNPIDGSVYERKTLSFEAQHVFCLNALTQSHQSLVLVIDEKLRVRTLDLDAAGQGSASAVLRREAHRVRLFTVSPFTGTVEGFSLMTSNSQITAIPTWSFVLPSLGGGRQRISDYALSQREVVFDRVVDSRPIFVSNSIVALTCVVDHSDREALSRDSSSSVLVYIFDGATGRLLHHGSHVDSEGPAPIVVSEHFVVYSLYNAAALRHEVIALEFYHDGDRIDVIQQAFVIDSGVNALGVSQTLRGVSAKEILLGLESGQVLAIGRSVLDPKRPTEELTAEQKKEGLIPYSPLLPLNTLSMPSYFHQVHRIASITAAPTRLESTSLILCSGLDMFFTPVTPSRPFDSLNEDFNLPFLIFTVSAVSIAIIITRRLAQAKKLSFEWD